MLLSYISRRLVSLLPILLGISLISFLILRLLPGDVAYMILSGGGQETVAVNPLKIAELRERLGLNEPLITQYLDWLAGLVTLDLGTSLWSSQPVLSEILNRLPLSLELATLSITISLMIGIPIGIVSSVYQNSFVDYLFRTVSICGLALPVFWLGTLLILALSVWFNWVPPLGYVRFTQNPWGNLQQMIWPALILGFGNGALISRMLRSTMLEVLREDYIRTAWAKGLDRRSVIFVHALRNAAVPVLTMIGAEFGFLVGGMVVLETIFTLPGIGRFLVDSILQRDYPVVQAIVLVLAVNFVLLNLIVDVLVGFIDPRIRQGGGVH